MPTGAWVRTQTVIVASPTARSRSEASITGTRGYRSPSIAVNGETTAAGSQRISAIRPTAEAPPWSYA